MAKCVTAIPATLTKFSSTPIKKNAKRKVAGYARVSTDRDEQFTSYEAQLEYYTNYIKQHDNWTFVDVYTDEGVSGTHTAKRTGFNTMISDALAGKIDLIITKSVSRFARNTVDSLSTIRKLKEKGVECYFEKENIWTFDGKGEVLLTIMSSFAQEESRSISENVLWGVKRKQEDGRISLAYSRFLGYDKGENGSLVINPVQAETVRFIFKSFLEGRSPYSIAQDLIKRGDKTGSGGTNWKAESIVRILKNEKYSGNAILQKSYKPDLLAKRRINNGEVQKYYVTDSHPAIITPEQYDMVQQELTYRHNSLRQHASKSIFTDKIFCADCGNAYGSKVWHSTDKYRRTIWQCNSKFKNDTKCSTPHLTEDEIKEAYLKALNQLITDKTSVIEDLQQICSMLLQTQKLEAQLAKSQEELSVATKIVQEYFNGKPVTENDISNGVFDTYQKQYTQAKQKTDNLQNKITERKRKAANLNRFIKSISEMDRLFETFSPELWTGLCDHMTVHPDKKVTVTFKSGTAFTVKL